jgi:myo-inositol-1-phosphate synthase
MRTALALTLCAAALLPGAALAGTVECQRLTRSIDHYEEMLARARELDNEMWEERTEDHVEVLKARRAESCPEYSPEAQATRAMGDLLRTAGKAALKYFTFGAF